MPAPRPAVAREPVVAIVLVAAAGCSSSGGGGDVSPGPLPAETFADPPELQPDDDGVRHLTFGPSGVELDGRRFCLRTDNGMVPAPAIRIPAGTDRRIGVDLVNDFRSSDHPEGIVYRDFVV